MILLNRFKFSISPIFGLFIALPLLYLFYYSFFSSSSLSFALSDIADYKILSYLNNTLLLVFGSVILALFFGVISSYLVARFEFFGSKLFSLLLILPLAFPTYIMGYAYNGIFEYEGLLARLTDNNNFHLDILNIWFAMLLFAMSMFPYVFIVAKTSFSSLSSNVDELVKLQNIGKVKAFFRIYIPLIYPAIFIGIFLVSLEVISDYGTVVYFGIDTFSVAIFRTWFGYNDLLSATRIASIFMLVIFFLLFFESELKKRFRYSTSSFSSKKAIKRKLNKKEQVFAFSFCFILLFFAFILPISVLVYWSYIDIKNFNIEIFNYYFKSLSLSFVSALLISFLAFIILFFTTQYKSKVGQIAHKFSMLGYAIPGAVVGIGAMLLFSKIDNVIGKYLFSGSFFALIFAYLVRFYPAATGSIMSGFSKIPFELQEASKLYGKGDFARMFKIYFPITKKFFVSGFLIVFIDITKELPATILLRPFNFDNLAIRIYELSDKEMLPSLGIPSLLLLSITIFAVLLLGLKK